MKVIYLLAALLLSAAVVILLGLSPQRITDDIMSLLHRCLLYTSDAADE